MVAYLLFLEVIPKLYPQLSNPVKLERMLDFTSLVSISWSNIQYFRPAMRPSVAQILQHERLEFIFIVAETEKCQGAISLP